jgi:large subunit ribosomal protein L23
MSARDIIIRPIVTEKTMKMSSDENKIAFVVDKGANKVSVAQAIKEIYGITAEKVNIVNVHPKTRRVGRYEGRTNAFKKAIVKLPEGASIDIFGTEE